MSIFIELSGRSYKVPDKITIGRGEPFTQFDSNKAVARAHLCLILKKGKCYLKDLGSKSGTKVNNVLIKPKTFIAITSEDTVEFANESLKLLARNPIGSFEEIKIVSNLIPLEKSFQKTYLILFVIGFLYFCFEVFKKTPFNLKYFSILLGVSVGFFLIFRLFIGFLIRKGSPAVKDIFYGNDGFTVHYVSGENMSFKLQKITSWNEVPMKNFVKITINNEDYYIPGTQGSNNFRFYLKSKIGKKQKKSISTKEIIIAVAITIGTLLILH